MTNTVHYSPPPQFVQTQYGGKLIKKKKGRTLRAISIGLALLSLLILNFGGYFRLVAGLGLFIIAMILLVISLFTTRRRS